MNCEKGDLAVIVKSSYGHEGKIVRCLDLYIGRVRSGYSPHTCPTWRIDTPLLKDGEIWPYMDDSCLKPLRDNPGTDETLLWAPVPSKLKEKA